MPTFTDPAIEFLTKSRAAVPRAYGIRLTLAGAFGLRGDLDEAKAEIAEAGKLKPDVNSLAAWRAAAPGINNPANWALRQKTINVGYAVLASQIDRRAYRQAYRQPGLPSLDPSSSTARRRC